MVTATITIGFDLIWAIAVGVAAAGILMLRHFANHAGVYRERDTEADGVAVFRMDGSMFFGVSDRIESEIEDLSGVDVVILRLSRVGVMDATGAKALSDLAKRLDERGKVVIIKGLPEQYVNLTKRVGLLENPDQNLHLVDDMERALEIADQWRDHKDYYL